MSSKNDYWDYLQHSRSHKYVKRIGTKGHYRYYYPEDLEKSDYDGLTKEERIKLDSSEYAKYEKMSYDQRKAYERKMRKRQMNYIDKKSKPLSSSKTKDGRYDIRDRVREQVTGRMDGDNIERRRRSKLKRANNNLVANNRFGEELEANHQSNYLNKELFKEINDYESKTVRGRIRRGRRKIKSKFKK